MKPVVNIMWFRRDLRLNDNAALYHALKDNNPVLPIFIFDRNILNQLDDKADRRVEFIHAALTDMQHTLAAMGSSLEVFYGFPEQVFKSLLELVELDNAVVLRQYATSPFVAVALVSAMYGIRSVVLPQMWRMIGPGMRSANSIWISRR